MQAKHALISGGSSGIGLALACRLAAAGWDISILARDAARLTAAVKRIESEVRGSGQSILAHCADVTDAPAVISAVEGAAKILGPPSLLVASAGIVEPGTFAALEAAAYTRTMDVNYFGAVNLVRAGLAYMRGSGGRIVLISSGAGLMGLYGYTAYAPTKFALRGFAEALRSELAPQGISVSIVYPPDTDTPQLRAELRARPAATSRIAAGAKVRQPGEVAAAIMRGIERGRFTIAPGWEMATLARFHSVIGPLLNRFWFDRVIARTPNRDLPEPE